MIEYLNAIASVLLLSITAVSLLRSRRLDLKEIADGINSFKAILDFLGNFPRWLHFYSNLTANVQKLQNKIDMLQRKWSDLDMEVNDDEFRTGRRRKREVDHWLNCAQAKCNEVETLLREMVRPETNHLCKFLIVAWQGNVIERKIVEVEDLLTSGSFEAMLLPVRERNDLVTTALVGNAANENIKTILTWLCSGVTKIGVYGIEGIGKTTVMMHIYNQLSRNDDVDVYMIQVPLNCNEYNLQSEIAKEVGIQLEVEDETRRAAFLHNALKRKNFVLILDGLTKDVSEHKVGIPLDAAKGKMIITSRYQDVCRKTGCQNRIGMGPVLENEALSLFKQKAGLLSELDIPKENVMRRIVEQCQGVPYKIEANARDLRGVEDIRFWEDTLHRLSMSNS